MEQTKKFTMTTSPHILSPKTVKGCMADVLIALIPALLCGVFFFGLYALCLVLICVVTCFVSEQIYNVIRKKPMTKDLSAIVTGLILGLNLPPQVPMYIPVIGGVFAIIVVKMLFGGLGKNFANPAATARVFLLIAYVSTMANSFILPSTDFSNFTVFGDAATVATYLGGGTAYFSANASPLLQLFLGSVAGCIGETSALAIMIGGIYLIVRRVIDWRIPLVYLLTCAFFTVCFYGTANAILYQLFSGGLMFGAVFMATDYATSPKWKANRVLYAFGLGLVTMLIRRFAGYPEGASLAIVFMNLLVPFMDRYILPVRFGEKTKGRYRAPVYQKTVNWLCVALAAAIAVAAPFITYTSVPFANDGKSEVQSYHRYLLYEEIVVKGFADPNDRGETDFKNASATFRAVIKGGKIVELTALNYTFSEYQKDYFTDEALSAYCIDLNEDFNYDSLAGATYTGNAIRSGLEGIRNAVKSARGGAQ